MPIKSILAQINATEHDASSLLVAVELAERFQCQLHALYVENNTNSVTGLSDIYVEIPTLNTAGIPVEESVIQSVLGRLGSHFHWEHTTGSITRALTTHSHAHDLVIVDQHQQQANIVETFFFPAANIAANCVCPVLMIPEDHHGTLQSQNPLLIWDASLNASRAMRSAMPFLSAAGRVEILVTPETNSSPLGFDYTTDKMVEYLTSQHIEIKTTEVLLDKQNVKTVLPSHVAHAGSDLIVMGAYSHSRLTDMAMGTINREVLKHSTLPVFMMH